MPCAVSNAVLIAINSEPNTAFLTLDFFFEYHTICASFKNMKNPVLELLLAPLPATITAVLSSSSQNSGLMVHNHSSVGAVRWEFLTSDVLTSRALSAARFRAILTGSLDTTDT